MKSKTLIPNLTASVIALATIATISQPSLAERRPNVEFVCGMNNGVPATIAQQQPRGNVAMIRWVRSFAPDSRWTPQERCEQVSRKFQENQQNGNLKYIVPGKSSANGLPVLCASRTLSPNIISCSAQQILMTLRQGDNPKSVIEQLMEVNNKVSGKPVDHKGKVLQCHPSALILKNGRRECPDNAVKGINVDFMLLDLQGDRSSSEESSCVPGVLGICQQ
ncbi:MAG: COP23 domain-containing protein [Nostochopsis sp.]